MVLVLSLLLNMSSGGQSPCQLINVSNVWQIERTPAHVFELPHSGRGIYIPPIEVGYSKFLASSVIVSDSTTDSSFLLWVLHGKKVRVPDVIWASE